MAVEIGIPKSELEVAVRKIRALGEFTTARQRKNILRKGARIMRDAARANVPIALEPYKNRKGEVIQPGFTRDAIEVKNLRRSPDLFVGVVKKNSQLAYWAAWLEFGATNRDGTKREGFAYMRRALASVKDQVTAQIIKDAQKLFEKIVNKLKVK